MFCCGNALPVALADAFFVLSGCALCAGVCCGVVPCPVGLCGGLALIGGVAGDLLDLEMVPAFGLDGGAACSGPWLGPGGGGGV